VLTKLIVAAVAEKIYVLSECKLQVKGDAQIPVKKMKCGYFKVREDK